MYEMGATVVLAIRDGKAGEFAKKCIQDEVKKSKGTLVVITIDLSDLQSVARFANDFKNQFSQLDYLINNAGVMMCPFGTTKQGIEIQFGTNHIGHFLLTQLLLDLVKNSKGRIINVSSIASVWFVHRKDIESFCSYKQDVVMDDGKSRANETSLYGRSKLANVLFTKKLARELGKEGVGVYCLHPGGVRTNLTRHFNSIFQLVYAPISWYFSKSAWQGAQTTLHLALSTRDSIVNGAYYSDCKLNKGSAFSNNEALQDTLYETSLKICQPYLQQ